MKTYNDCPVVQVGNALQNEDWFNLADGRIIVNHSPTDFAQGIYPYQVIAVVNYLDVPCEFTISNGNDGRPFKIRVTDPNWLAGKMSRPSRPSSVRKVVNKVRDLFTEALPDVEKRHEEYAKEQIEKKIRQEKIMATANALGLNLVQDSTWDDTRMTFKMSKDHEVEFKIPESEFDKRPEAREYYVCDFTGYVTFNELKQILDLMATLPSAVAARLTKGK